MRLLEFPTEVFHYVIEVAVRTDLQQAIHARLVCSKLRSWPCHSPFETFIDDILELFDFEIAQAVYRTKILEEPEFVNRRVPRPILEVYACRLAESERGSRCFKLRIIDQTWTFCAKEALRSTWTAGMNGSRSFAAFQFGSPLQRFKV
jgi:hypothetical protein